MSDLSISYNFQNVSSFQNDVENRAHLESSNVHESLNCINPSNIKNSFCLSIKETKNIYKKNQCKICGSQLSTSSGFKQHMTKMHRNNIH